MRKSIEERLAQLDARRATLKARLSKQDRANDTRRKVLLGAFVLHHLESSKDEEFTRGLSGWLKQELPGFLKRQGDKELFPDILEISTGQESAAKQVKASRQKAQENESA